MRFVRLAICEYPSDIGGSGRENSCDLLFFRRVADTREPCDQPASRRVRRSVEG